MNQRTIPKLTRLFNDSSIKSNIYIKFNMVKHNCNQKKALKASKQINQSEKKQTFKRHQHDIYIHTAQPTNFTDKF